MDKQIEKKEIYRLLARKWIKWAVAFVVVAVAIVWLFNMLGGSVEERELRFGEVTEGPLETMVVASGNVMPAYEEVINSPVDSRILKAFVQSGDSVTEGMPLLELDLETATTDYAKLQEQRKIKEHELEQLRLNNKTILNELSMQIKVKEMEVNRLRVDVENERRLDSLGSGTGDRVRQAETSYATEKLQLQQLREKLVNQQQSLRASEDIQRLNLSSFDKDMDLTRRTLAEGRIPAPHGGVVTYINDVIGSRIAKGEKVAVVADLSQFKIQGETPEGNGDKVAIGSEVTARIGEVELVGLVTNIAPQSNSGNISFTVALQNPRHPRLRAGIRTELYISYGYKDKTLLIPNASFFKGPGEYQLFVLDGADNLVKRNVRLGDSNREFIEVESGLLVGDKVVISNMDSYSKKDKLKIKK